ncbi:hypothetical protein [Sphingomonas sanguinis]|uniref:hypothetical protein n=1 Tax=Sphingomonas sanguinis TaxID=33051 RepID=UPI0035A5FE42
MKAAPALLERAGRMRYLLADKGYDADRLRRSLCDAGAVPVMPGRRARKRAIRYGRDPIPWQAPHRERLLPSQGFPPCRHPLRQTRHQLPLKRRHRNRICFLALIEPQSRLVLHGRIAFLSMSMTLVASLGPERIPLAE